VLDNAGWLGPKGPPVSGGVSLAHLPPHSPELQPAERLWPLVDEPVVNRHLAGPAEFDSATAELCPRLDAAAIRPHTDLRWRPRPTKPS
jgi:hypothetical protein